MRSAIFGILTLLCAAPLGAQETRAIIRGTVSDSLGVELAGVTVLVDESALGIETDAAGGFRVRSLTGGAYRLSFHLAGFVPRTFRIRIPDGYQGEYAVGQVMLQPVREGFVTLTGTVRDSTTMEPVPGVTIGLEERVATFTDRDGRFRVDNVKLGTVYLEARRIGYRPVTMHIDIIEGETFDLGISAVPLPFSLEDIEVTVDDNFASFGPMQGFMQRRRRGQGYSFLRWEIEEENPLYVTDLLRTLPGVRVRRDALGEQYITFRGCGSPMPKTPTVYVNGIQMDSDAWKQLEWLVHPENLEAMEVHLGAYTPAEYRNYDACGVIAIWTR
jgi:hypothetical protein